VLEWLYPQLISSEAILGQLTINLRRIMPRLTPEQKITIRVYDMDVDIVDANNMAAYDANSDGIYITPECITTLHLTMGN
jgi:hypothetical protein